MSHFTVLVIGDNVEEQLQPYHEYECTGVKDQYVVWMDDIHDEYMNEYNNNKIKAVIDKATNKIIGTKYSKNPVIDSMWKRTGFGISSNDEFIIKDGYQLKEVPFSEVYSSFDNFIKDWAGYDEKHPETGRYGHWTNPNAKWDWYLIGGRWTGFFKLKTVQLLETDEVIFNEIGMSNGEISQLVSRYAKDPDSVKKILSKMKGKGDQVLKLIEKYTDVVYPKHLIGKPGLMTDPAKIGYADQVMKRYIDVESMRQEAVDKALVQYDKLHMVLGDSINSHIPWKEFLDKADHKLITWDEARKQYHAQESVKLKDANKELIWYNIEDYNMPREKYAEAVRQGAISTFAIIKDGKWFERGNMGWWGAVGNEKDKSEWDYEFNKLFDSLPDDTLLTVVDCHI